MEIEEINENHIDSFVGIEISEPLNLRLFRGNKSTTTQKEYQDEMTIIQNIDKTTEIKTFEQTVIQWNKLLSNQYLKDYINHALIVIEEKYFQVYPLMKNNHLFHSQLSSFNKKSLFNQWCWDMLNTHPSFSLFYNQFKSLIGESALTYTIELWKTLIYLQSL